MPMYKYICECGVTIEEYRTVDKRHEIDVCYCGRDMKLGVSESSVVGCESFNPHYDISLGRFFGSAEEKRGFLASEGRKQIGGEFSPRKSSKSQILCSREQSKHLDSPTGESEKKRKEL